MYVIQHKVGRYLASINPVAYCDDIRGALQFINICTAYEVIGDTFAFPHVVDVVEVGMVDRDKS